MMVFAQPPYELRTNLGRQVDPYYGPATISFELRELTDEVMKPFFASCNIWARAVNAQFFTLGDSPSCIELLSIDQGADRSSLVLTMACENLEPAAWIALLSQLGQVAQHTTALSRVGVMLDGLSLPGHLGLPQPWLAAATHALFTCDRRPESFADVPDFLYEGKMLSVELEFNRDLIPEEFAEIESDLQLWGCLLATGGLRVDFSLVTEPLDALSFGVTTQLTPSWVRYIKNEFDGPVEAVALLDHWVAALRHRGLEPESISVH